MKPKLIIFDMDGTLIDTESLYTRAYDISCKEFGVPIDENIHKQFIGLPMSEKKKILFDICHDMGKVDDIMYSSTLMVKYLIRNEGLELKDGVIEFLDYLKNKGYTLAVATASRKDLASTRLEIANILDYFSTVTCGDEVANNKPHPDLYLRVMEIHNVKPEDCIVFEDSKNGLIGGTTAGIKTFLVPDMLEPTEDMKSMAYKVLNKISDAIELID